MFKVHSWDPDFLAPTARSSRSVVGRSALIPLSRWRIDPIRLSIRRSFLFFCHSATDLRTARIVLRKIRGAARARAATLATPSTIPRMELCSFVLFCRLFSGKRMMLLLAMRARPPAQPISARHLLERFLLCRCSLAAFGRCPVSCCARLLAARSGLAWAGCRPCGHPSSL